MPKTKKKLITNKEIVTEYFRLVQKKDIEGLKDLFWPDGIVFEPFSKLEEGLRGWSQIEPFMKVAIMANESLSYRIALEEFEDKDMKKNKKINELQESKRNNDDDDDDDNEVVESLVTFQKDGLVRTKLDLN